MSASFSLKDIDVVIDVYKKKGGRGKSLDIIRALRKEYHYDRDVQRLATEYGKLDFQLTKLYPGILPLTAKEHYYTVMSEINSSLEKFYFAGSNPKAIGINADQFFFHRLSINARKENKHEQRKNLKRFEQSEQDIVELRRQLHQLENKRMLRQQEIDDVKNTLSAMKRQLTDLKGQDERRLDDLWQNVQQMRREMREYESILKGISTVRKWSSKMLVFRIAKRIQTLVVDRG